MARTICFTLLTHWARRAASRADWTAGKSSAIRTAMMAMTTNSSISVKPRRFVDMGWPPGVNGWRGAGGPVLISRDRGPVAGLDRDRGIPGDFRHDRPRRVL